MSLLEQMLMAKATVDCGDSFGDKGHAMFENPGDATVFHRLTKYTNTIRGQHLFANNELEKLLRGENTHEDLLEIAVAVFHTRSISNGKGERELFHQSCSVLEHEGYAWIVTEVLLPCLYITNTPGGGPHGCLKDLCAFYDSSSGYVAREAVYTMAALIVRDLTYAAEVQLNEHARAVLQSAHELFHVLVLDRTRFPLGDEATPRGFVYKYAPRERHGQTAPRKEFQMLVIFYLLFDGDVWFWQKFHAGGVTRKRIDQAQRMYRKILAALRESAEQPTAEHHMSHGNFRLLVPDKMPGKCLLRNTTAMLRTSNAQGVSDHDRRVCAANTKEFLAKPIEERANVNAKALNMEELVAQYYGNSKNVPEREDPMLESFFRSKCDTFLEKHGKSTVAVLSDVSLSMHSPIIPGRPNGIGRPFANSIGIGAFLAHVGHQFIMTFSEKTEFVPVGTTLRDTMQNIQDKNQNCNNTNFYNAMEILCQAKVGGSDIQTLVVLSDMQLGQAEGGRPLSSAYANIVRMFKTNGLTKDDIPVIVYWNLAATETVVAHANTEKTILVSGYSTAIVDCLVSGDIGRLEQFTPAKALEASLHAECFDFVRTKYISTRQQFSRCEFLAYQKGVEEEFATKIKYARVVDTLYPPKNTKAFFPRGLFKLLGDRGHVIGKDGARLRALQKVTGCKMTLHNKRKSLYVSGSDIPKIKRAMTTIAQTLKTECAQRGYRHPDACMHMDE